MVQLIELQKILLLFSLKSFHDRFPETSEKFFNLSVRSFNLSFQFVFGCVLFYFRVIRNCTY